MHEPWELVGMDLIGKLSMTSSGNQYICVFTDYFTKWVEAHPLTSKTAEEVTMCIVKLFYRFGAPKRILTDQGREFVNQVCISTCSTIYFIVAVVVIIFIMTIFYEQFFDNFLWFFFYEQLFIFSRSTKRSVNFSA